MTNVNSFYGAYLILKDSLSFLWNNKRIAPVVWFFLGLTTFLMLAIPALYFAFYLQPAAAGDFKFIDRFIRSVPFIDYISNSEILAGVGKERSFANLVFVLSVILGPLLVIVWSLSAFFPGVSEANYVLSALRNQPVTFGDGLSQGFAKCVRSWRILVGIFFVAVALFFTPLLLLKLLSYITVYTAYIGLAFVAILYLLYLVLFVIKFYFWQLIADGNHSFRSIVKQSVHYLKKSWLALLAVSIYISIASHIAGNLLSIILGMWVQALIGLLLAPVWAVVINKIYLVVREEGL